MVLAAGGLTWLSLAAGTSEIWPINFVWMCFPTSDLVKVDGVAVCRWVRHSIIHHVSIHCFIDASWCFRFFHLNVCFIISSLHCIALCISLYSLLVASRKLSTANLEAAKVHWLWHEHRSAPGARKRVVIHRDPPSSFPMCQGGCCLCRHWGCIQESWLHWLARNFVKKQNIANWVHCLAIFLSPQGTCGRSFVWNPAFPLLVLRWSWSLLENLCNFWGIPWAQIVPYGRSIGTAPSIHLARSYPVRGVASYLIWALYDFCFGNLSKHVCPSPSLQHICHLHHRTSDLASNSPKLWSFNSSPFFLHHSLIHWLFALRFCKVQWCRSIGYRDGLSFWSLAKAASACSRNLSSNAGTFGSWPFMILYWLTIADWSRHCGGFISCRFIWHRLTCWLLGCILYALRFRLRFTLPGDIFTNIDKIGDLVTNRHPTNQKFGFYEWCSSFYKTSSFSCQSYEY